mgnify:CR=1 FL=1
MNKETFYEELAKLNIFLTSEQKEELDTYCKFLISYNEHTNLTAIKEPNDIYLKHFYDSLTLVKIHEFKDETLLDVGTGAGFPGVVLAIVFPSLKITLLDSNNKKIKFLDELIVKLNLKNVTTVHDRAENYVQNHREKFDLVTSRAVAELRILLELNIPYLKVNGQFLVMKSSVEEELEKATSALKVLNCHLDKEFSFSLPFEAGKRTLLLIIKDKETNLKYPRLYEKIKKQKL